MFIAAGLYLCLNAKCAVILRFIAPFRPCMRGRKGSAGCNVLRSLGAHTLPQ